VIQFDITGIKVENILTSTVNSFSEMMRKWKVWDSKFQISNFKFKIQDFRFKTPVLLSTINCQLFSEQLPTVNHQPSTHI